MPDVAAIALIGALLLASLLAAGDRWTGDDEELQDWVGLGAALVALQVVSTVLVLAASQVLA